MKDNADTTEADILCADSARVASEYDVLDLQGTKTAFEELDNFLYGLADELIQTLDQIIPHLAEMQTLLSQRGKARKSLLKMAGLPSWPEYGQAYATKLDCSFRTIQDHITGLRRNGKSGPSQSAKNGQQPKRDGGTKRSKPWHADAKDSRAMAESQIEINDLVAAYEAGADLAPAYQRYKQVALSPTKLNSILEAASSDPIKADVEAEVKKKLVPAVETAERYIRALEALVHSPSVTLTDDQRKALQKPMEAWRGILRFTRGVEAERKGKGVPMENVPDALKEAA